MQPRLRHKAQAQEIVTARPAPRLPSCTLLLESSSINNSSPSRPWLPLHPLHPVATLCAPRPCCRQHSTRALAALPITAPFTDLPFDVVHCQVSLVYAPSRLSPHPLCCHRRLSHADYTIHDCNWRLGRLRRQTAQQLPSQLLTRLSGQPVALQSAQWATFRAGPTRAHPSTLEIRLDVSSTNTLPRPLVSQAQY